MRAISHYCEFGQPWKHESHLRRHGDVGERKGAANQHASRLADVAHRCRLVIRHHIVHAESTLLDFTAVSISEHSVGVAGILG